MSEKAHTCSTGDRGDCYTCFCIENLSNASESDYTKCQTHLKNWKEWMKKRKQIQNALSQRLNRPPDELLMNIGEEYRFVQEEKSIFEYTKITTTFDKYRGNPDFWKLPVGLVNKCQFLRDPIYFTTKTKEEKNEIPDIVYVGTPSLILNEKNILPRTRNLYKLWKNSQYRKEKMEKLAFRINLIMPHNPQFDDLIVIGKKSEIKIKPPVHEKKSSSQVSIQQIEMKDNSEEGVSQTESHFQINLIPKTCFIINGNKLKERNFANDTIKIRILFECDTSEKLPTIQKVKFENKGLTALRFYWKKYEKFRLFSDISRNENEEVFYFDKRELILVPGQTVELPIWFKPTKVKNYLECWEVVTLPKMWEDDFRLIVILQGIRYMKDFEDKAKKIKQSLENNVRNTLIRDLLSKIFISLKFSDTSTLTYSFSEEQVFEGVNQEILGVQKKSKYIYNKHIVKKLQDFYKTIRSPDNSNIWNYSIKELKKIARKKDIWNYVESKAKYALLAKRRRRELRNTNNDQDQVMENSIDTVEEDTESYSQKESNFSKLETILKELERPSMIKNVDREKYFIAYSVMRTYMHKMCDALENNIILENLDSENSSYYPTYDNRKVMSVDQLPERLIFERFDDVWLNRTKQVPPETRGDILALPKPDILKNVPVEDAKKIYKLYFNVPDTAQELKEKKKKGKDKKEKPAQKEKGPGKKKGKSEKAKDDVIEEKIPTIKPDFNPFAEDYFTCNITEQSEVEARPDEDYVIKTKYDYQTYLIVYSHLSQAVDALVDSLETLRETTVPVNLLGEVVKCDGERIFEKVTQSSEGTSSLHGKEFFSCKSEDDIYFRYLLSRHLNKHTDEYVVHGHVKHSPEDDEPSLVSQPSKSISTINVFQSRETVIQKPVETYSGCESIGIQTSETNEDYKKFSNILLNEEVCKESESVKSSIDEASSHDIFYFMDDNNTRSDMSEENKLSDQSVI